MQGPASSEPLRSGKLPFFNIREICLAHLGLIISLVHRVYGLREFSANGLVNIARIDPDPVEATLDSNPTSVHVS